MAKLERFEKIFKRDNGDQISIICSLYIDSFREEAFYSTAIKFKSKGKKKWLQATKEQYTQEEVNIALIEYWNTLHPKNIV